MHYLWCLSLHWQLLRWTSSAHREEIKKSWWKSLQSTFSCSRTSVWSFSPNVWRTDHGQEAFLCKCLQLSANFLPPPPPCNQLLCNLRVTSTEECSREGGLFYKTQMKYITNNSYRPTTATDYSFKSLGTTVIYQVPAKKSCLGFAIKSFDVIHQMISKQLATIALSFVSKTMTKRQLNIEFDVMYMIKSGVVWKIKSYFF